MGEILILFFGSILFSIGFAVRFFQTRVLPYAVMSASFFVFFIYAFFLLLLADTTSSYVGDVFVGTLVLLAWSLFLLFPLSATYKRQTVLIVTTIILSLCVLFSVVFLLTDLSSLLVPVRGALTIPILLGAAIFSVQRLFKSARRGALYYFIFLISATFLTAFAITSEALQYLLLLSVSSFVTFGFFLVYSFIVDVDKAPDVFGNAPVKLFSIRSRILLIVFTVVVLVSLMATSIFFVVSRDLAEAEGYHSLRSSGNATTQILKNIIEQDVQDMRQLSEAKGVRDAIAKGSSPQGLLSFGDERTLEGIYILDDGDDVVHEELVDGVFPVNDFNFLKDGRVLDVYFDFSLERYFVIQPIVGSQVREGYVVGVYSFDLVLEILSKLSSQGAGAAYIVGRGNEFWSRAGYGVVDDVEISLIQSCAQAALVCERGSCDDGGLIQEGEYTGLNGEDVFSSSRYLPDEGVCIVHEIDQSLITVHPSRSTTIIASIIILVLLVALWFATRYLSKSVTHSLVALQEGVRRIKSGKYGEQIHIDSDDEIAELAEIFNRLSTSLKEARESTEENISRQTQELKGQKEKLEKTQRAMLNVLQDVNLDKERLQHEKEKIEVIVQGMQDAFIFVGKSGKIEIYNNAAEEILGYPSSQAMGVVFTKMIKLLDAKDRDFVIDLADLRSGQDIQAKNLVLTNSVGAYVPVRFSASSVRHENEAIGFALLFQDVTKEREIEKMKSNFVSIVSHQLRTPLSAIKWLLEMVLGKDAGDINSEQEDYLSRAYDSNERMITLVSELLKVSRLESGKIKAEPKEMNLTEVIEGVIEDHKVNAKAHNCVLSFSTEASEIPTIQADPTLIQNVLDNFVSNAIDYASPQKQNNVQIGVKVEKNEVVVAVKDDGIGIKLEDQEKVFGMFYRGDNARKARTDGSGLGLYIARLMIELSGGKIWFESEHEKGSTFYFSLPR